MDTSTCYVTVYDSDSDSDYQIFGELEPALKLMREWMGSEWVYDLKGFPRQGEVYVAVYKQDIPDSALTDENWSWWDHVPDDSLMGIIIQDRRDS